ncbi:MAG: tetratricopeptide repeat protein [Phycisphaerales bacterium]|nr:tetratricopeptide repeat protein [Phycisphaerales bacterium]
MGGTLATLLALTAGLVATSVLLLSVDRERRATVEAARRTKEVAEFQREVLEDMHPGDIGSLIESSLAHEYERVLAEQSGGPQAAADELSRLASILEQTNATNIGREVLDGVLIDRAIELIEGRYQDDPLAEAEIRAGIFDTLQRLGRTREAVEQARLIYRLRLNALGPGAIDTISARLRLGRALVSAREYEEAEVALKDVIATAPARGSTPNLMAAQATIRLGVIYREREQTEQAETTLRRGLQMARAIDDSRLIAIALNEIGVLQLNQGDTRAATTSFEENLRIMRTEFATERAEMIRATSNVMAAMFKDGRFAEAERYARDVVPLYSAEYGDEHPQAINSRNNLARVLLDIGETDEAAAILDREYELSQRVLGPGNAIREAVATNYIEACLTQGHAEDGRRAARMLLADRRAAPHPRAGSIAQTLEQLGECLLALGANGEAEASFAECIELRESINSDHWLTHRARTFLGIALLREGRRSEAEPLLVEGAAGLERHRDDISPNMRERELNHARRRVEELRTRQP